MEDDYLNNLNAEHLTSLSGTGLYSYISNSQYSKPFHDLVEKTIKSGIGDFKNPYMDAVSGKWHRWKHGHDPLDVLEQVIKDPLGRGKLDAGHFVTDFFTKDGVPLPGLSKDYLGGAIKDTLEHIGVENPIKWLNMNGFDHFFGGLSLINSGCDLANALSSTYVDFTWQTAFETFGVGASELFFGVSTGNVWLLASGATECISGAILLYKDLNHVEPTIYEKLIDNLPNSSEVLSALSFYMAASSLKNFISFSKGNIKFEELTKRTVTDVSVSLSSFIVTKSLIATFATAATGGMLLPVLIGGGSSLLFREIFKMTFPDNAILIKENELWKQSPFQYNSPWSKNLIDKGNIWNNDVFHNNNIWQKSLFNK